MSERKSEVRRFFSDSQWGMEPMSERFRAIVAVAIGSIVAATLPFVGIHIVVAFGLGLGMAALAWLCLGTNLETRDPSLYWKVRVIGGAVITATYLGISWLNRAVGDPIARCIEALR